jgi:hypothetical protein
VPGYSAVSRAREFPNDVATSIKNEPTLTAISTTAREPKRSEGLFGIAGILIAAAVLATGIYLVLIYLL